MDPTHLILLAFASAGAALLFRALPWPKRWIDPPMPAPLAAADATLSALTAFHRALRRRWFLVKFFGCPACAGGRAALVLVLPDAVLNGTGVWPAVLAYFACAAVAALVYVRVNPPSLGLEGLGDE